MQALWQPLALALSRLTTLPLPHQEAPDPYIQARAPLTYPLVGLLLGLLLIGASWALFDLVPLAAAAIMLALWTLLTGAQQLNKLADCADRLLGASADAGPAIGRAALVTLVLCLIGKWAGLSAAHDTGHLTALLLAPLLGYSAALALMCALPRTGPGQTPDVMIDHLARKHGWLVLAAVGLLSLLLAPMALLAAALVTWLVQRAAQHRLGGVSDAVYSAAVELVEIAVLLVLAVPGDA